VIDSSPLNGSNPGSSGSTDGYRNSDGLVVDITTRGSAVIVTPRGDIDLSGSPAFRLELRKAQLSKPARLIIDLAEVGYMDSSGVATLVEAMQSTRKNNATLVLCSMQERVRSVFEIARLHTVFTIVPDTDAALA
jgi:anti-sigma B factor antagonist